LIEEILPTRANYKVFRAEALPRPIGVTGRKINWRYVVAVGSYHLLAPQALLCWFCPYDRRPYDRPPAIGRG
jgi:hypothetical protein